ncbi:YbjN domain-containing protein [Labilibaculum sp. DW002]|uniref:YbjN domain-containing protein n=1 Tax=Paralabilibaculum antarcticum TaxID=2912572 RepID=A0ABT5VV97_9BACT|nr:YbjN domain-containing protein [Labilibaculum sp. DW002]MDE5419335.1 YbjN domain-containing protein [Labilibaculum sp. DW002]
MNTYYNKVKEYLLNLEFNIVQEDTAEELFVVENPDGGIANLIIDCEDPILIIEGLLFELTEENPEVYKSLLKKNREIVHGAFVLDESGKKIIFRDTLQLENLDQNELEATLNSLELLLSEFSEEIISYSKS